MFKPYEPEVKIDKVNYLINEDGIDWYDFRNTLHDHTIKLIISSDKFIVNSEENKNMIYPIYSDVVEVNKDELPIGFNSNGDWSYIDGKIINSYEREDVKKLHNNRKLKSQLQDIQSKITYLTYKFDVSETTSDERDELIKLKKQYIEIYDKLS